MQQTKNFYVLSTNNKDLLYHNILDYVTYHDYNSVKLIINDYN